MLSKCENGPDMSEFELNSKYLEVFFVSEIVDLLGDLANEW